MTEPYQMDPQTELALMRGHLDILTKALADGELSDGHHTHNELYEYRLLYNAYAAYGLYAAGHTVIRSWKHHGGELCFGGGWFIVVMYVPTPDGSEVQVTNHYKAEAWDLFDQIPELPESLPWDGHTPAEAAQRLREGIELARPAFSDLKYDSERVASVETDLRWALSELGHEHWQNCHTTDDGCYQCGGYLELKEKYDDA